MAPWLPQGSSVDFVTWNARALHHHRPHSRLNKLRFLGSLVPRAAGSFSVLALQEVHGSPEKHRRLLHSILKDFHMFSSFAPAADESGLRQDQGGVITLIPKAPGEPRHRFVRTEIIPGRVLRVTTKIGEFDWTHWNIHNFGLTAAQVRAVADHLRRDAREASRSPTSRFVVVCGDFNFLAPGEHHRALSKPDARDRREHPAASAGRPAWQRALDSYIEIKQPFDTHFHSATRTLGRIDRLYVASPTWLVLQLRLRGRLLRDPALCHQQLLSDHAPVAFKFSTRCQLPDDQRPIPKFVVDHPRFPEILSSLVETSHLHELSVPDRLSEFKSLMRNAARLTRNEILALDPRSLQARATTCASIARAVWHCDAGLARVLLKRSAIARRHLKCTNGIVTLTDSFAFTQAYELARAEDLRRRRTDAHRDLHDAQDPALALRQHRRQMANFNRLGRIWAPFGKQLPIVAIRVGDRLEHHPDARLSSLADAWSSTFSTIKPIDRSLAREVIKKQSSDLDFDDFAPPSSACIRSYLTNVRNSAPGIDGLPYRAWLQAGPSAWTLLHEVAVWLCAGLLMPCNFNDALFIFVPKGTEDDDETGIIRSPSATRPLGLKNTDVKCISGATHFLIRHSIAKFAARQQNGFVHGRNFINNVVDLDTRARCLAMNDLLPMPIMLFTDFGAAFPSVIHEWLFLVLEMEGFPPGLRNLIVGIHSQVTAYGLAGSMVLPLFFIFSGVIQGCPLASDCFLFAFNPFLVMLGKLLDLRELGITRACADDLGFALSDILHLKIVATILKLARQLAGLSIKLRKCTLVPLGRWSDDLCSFVLAWIVDHLPEWIGMDVAPFSKYLGFFLGPLIGDLMWRAPLAKWRSRTTAITATGAPPSIAAGLYNKFAFPTLSYVAQLCPPTADMLRREPFVIASLLHIPPQSFALSDLHSLKHWGSIRLRSVGASLHATTIRAATLTLSTWRADYAALKHDSDLYLPMASVIMGQLGPAHWDSPPLAATLHEASMGFPDRRLLAPHAPDAVHEAIETHIALVPKAPFKFQRFVTERLETGLYPDTIPKLVRRRAPMLCPGIVLGDISFDLLREMFGKLSPAWATAILKTWANAWTTSSRMHEPVARQCIFGCAEGMDSLKHYLLCDHVWPLSALDAPDINERAAQRMLLRPHVQHSQIFDAVFAFNFYHAAKRATDLSSQSLHRLRAATHAHVLQTARGGRSL